MGGGIEEKWDNNGVVKSNITKLVKWQYLSLVFHSWVVSSMTDIFLDKNSCSNNMQMSQW